MARKTKKILLLAVAGIVLIGAVIGYKMYNKKHFSVASASPAAAMSAIDLHKAFSTDTTVAKNKFIGDEANQKVIQVSGEVSDINKDQLQHVVIKLKTATDGAFINCEMEGNADGVIAGNKIVLKGICSGYLFEADLGIPGDVILTRCIIAK